MDEVERQKKIPFKSPFDPIAKVIPFAKPERRPKQKTPTERESVMTTPEPLYAFINHIANPLLEYHISRREKKALLSAVEILLSHCQPPSNLTIEKVRAEYRSTDNSVDAQTISRKEERFWLDSPDSHMAHLTKEVWRDARGCFFSAADKQETRVIFLRPENKQEVPIVPIATELIMAEMFFHLIVRMFRYQEVANFQHAKTPLPPDETPEISKSGFLPFKKSPNTVNNKGLTWDSIIASLRGKKKETDE